MLTRVALSITALFLLALCQSCSLFVGSNQSVAITATDPQADIYVDGNLIGRGSATTELRRNKSHAILARCGDRAGTATIGTNISTTGVLDIVGGIFFLVPLIGIAGPGFWELETTTVTVAIPPASGSGQ